MSGGPGSPLWVIHERTLPQRRGSHPLGPVLPAISIRLHLQATLPPSLALATDVHTVTGAKGQPNQEIGTTDTGSATPGHASTARGSAFNPDNGIAGANYADEQDQNDNNPKRVSQYDVAGFQQSHNH